jgi:hypothetical protein
MMGKVKVMPVFYLGVKNKTDQISGSINRFLFE